MSKIVVIGSSNMDQTVRTPHIPAKGETVFGGEVQMSFGGKGANQAVAAQCSLWPSNGRNACLNPRIIINNQTKNTEIFSIRD